MAREWAGKLLLSLIIYYTLFVLIMSYGTEMVESFGDSIGGEITNDVDLNSTFGAQSTCNYPRYKYNADGDASRYWFDIDNTDCDISSGAISPQVCNSLNGCLWSNETTGFLWFRSVTGVCTGQINKTFYNDGDPTSENICKMDGLQGNDKILRCGAVGCTSYEPKEDATGGVSSPLVVLDTVGDLFSFRYDFGFEEDLYSFAITFLLVYFPLLLIIMCIYLLSPFSNVQL